MAATSNQSGNPVAQAIQNAVQPKLIENGWVVEENDTTLSEYVSMMLVDGKDMNSVQAELGGELLGLGEDDPTVGEFVRWLFTEVQNKVAGAQQETQPTPPAQDSQMEDASGQVGAAPTGPKSMRTNHPTRGRGGRMLGQLNRQMDRSQDLPDSLRRIKGAAGGGSGRINSHANRDGPPRGPRGSSIANGVQRMMGGAGRGGHAMNNQMMQMGGGGMEQQQMQLMQFMEMQTNMMMQMMQNGQVPNANGGFNQRGGHRGGRQNSQFTGRQQPQQQQQQQKHAVNGRLPDGPLQGGPNTDTSMEVDGNDGNTTRKDLFDTLCRYNLNCTMPNCGRAHQSPAAPEGTTVDLTDTCSFGIKCQNTKCSGRHPSPALLNSAGPTVEVDCKYGANCTRPNCHFRHQNAPPCRNGADCDVPNCKFAHTTALCRYNPCTKEGCIFKHAPGQKAEGHGSNVWTKDGAGKGTQNGGTSNRFADISSQTADGEELILPGGQQNGNPTANTAEIEVDIA